jgi:N-acetylmuramoyl-L-alanine amidase
VGYIVADSQAPAQEVLSKLGSRGDEVRRIQRKLRDLGFYSGAVDGIYGVNTRSAVKRFQSSVGITADGVAGSKTLLYLGLGGNGNSGGGNGYSSSDVYLLAKVIAAEARGESYTGQVAVGAVVLNRVESASFPDSISGVVYQAGAFSAVTDSNWSVSPSATSRKAAQDAINGWDPSYGCLYYYNPAKTSNRWIRTRPVVTTIGSHVFCK